MRESLRPRALLGRALRSLQLSVSTSIVFMHRFYARKSFKEYDRFILACTCLLLGGKVEETPKKLKDVLTEAYRVRHNCRPEDVPGAESREFWKMKEQILVSERILLQTLGFELQIEHPYRPLLAYVKAIQASRDFAQLAWNFVNDSYRTVICLQYTHETVAAAAVLLAAAFNGVTVVHVRRTSATAATARCDRSHVRVLSLACATRRRRRRRCLRAAACALI